MEINVTLVVSAIIALSLLVGVLSFRKKKTFEQVPLLNRSEQKLFSEIKKIVGSEQYIYPQVSYGEFLRHSNKRKFWDVNARRADIVIADKGFNVTTVIEYQGTGHYGRGIRSWLKALSGDRTKRKALQEARIKLVEVPADYTLDRLRKALK